MKSPLYKAAGMKDNSVGENTHLFAQVSYRIENGIP